MGIVEKIADKIVHYHHIVVENRLCSRFRTSKSDCSICADLCPVDGILISDRGAEIREGCIDCGVCMSACPNGVFGITGRDDKKIAAEIVSRVRDQKPSIFRISCEHGDRASDLVVSCLSRLTESLLLEPFRAGAAGVEICRPSCKECPSQSAASHMETVLLQTRHICEMLGIRADRISVVNSRYDDGGLTKQETWDAESKTLSRRDFFGSFRIKAMEVAADSIPEIERKNGESDKLFREVIRTKPENIKRSRLLEIIRDMAEKHKDQDTRPAVERGLCVREVPSESCITAEIEVDEKCTACGVCATLCPTGAITQNRTEENYTLNFRPDLCANCRVCVKTCMPKAIRIKDKTNLNILLEEENIKLFEAKKSKCTVCGMDFVGGGSGICPLCMHIHNKQMAAIQGLFKKGGSRE